MWFNSGNKKNIDICKNMDDSQTSMLDGRRQSHTDTQKHIV